LQGRLPIFGLTGTPLFDMSNRVIEMASLMGNCYVTGQATFWRRLERISKQHNFLMHFLDPIRTRMEREQVQNSCVDWVAMACFRNRSDELQQAGIKCETRFVRKNMSEKSGQAYLKGMVSVKDKNFGIGVDAFDAAQGRNVQPLLNVNAALSERGEALMEIIDSIHAVDPTEKIIIFADEGSRGGDAVVEFFEGAGRSDKFVHIKNDDSGEERGQKLSWFKRKDTTEEEKKRPRCLLLQFDHASGLNLQICCNVVLMTPRYSGTGGERAKRAIKQSHASAAGIKITVTGTFCRRANRRANERAKRVRIINAARQFAPLGSL